MIVVDPVGGITSLIGLWRESKRAHEWARLVFSMMFTVAVSLLGVTGLRLIAGDPPWLAFGYGLLAAACTLLALWLRHPYTRKMMIVVPKEVIEVAQKAEPVVIERGEH